jgi:hypothetical protein
VAVDWFAKMMVAEIGGAVNAKAFRGFAITAAAADSPIGLDALRESAWIT